MFRLSLFLDMSARSQRNHVLPRMTETEPLSLGCQMCIGAVVRNDVAGARDVQLMSFCFRICCDTGCRDHALCIESAP